jgi:hypothetical protein
MDRTHKLCDGTGWLCEAHPDLPFGHDGCPGPGVPCACNPKAEVDWREVHCSVADTGPKTPG